LGNDGEFPDSTVRGEIPKMGKRAFGVLLQYYQAVTKLRLSVVLCAVLLALSAAAQGPPFSRAEFTERLVAAAVARSRVHVRYDAAYVRIPYPGGDVPANTGTCADEIIRIYRAVGIDLQKQVHEDMSTNFTLYPRKWNRASPDANIDHRRVPNLITFFERNGEVLPRSPNARDYLPGDIVTWDLGGGLTHIGMVVDRKPLLFDRYKILHNIGRGPQIEDVLFDWKITGHFRYYGPAGTIR
jgi:uncharacterized protein YijF (DUF1287 family)